MHAATFFFFIINIVIIIAYIIYAFKIDPHSGMQVSRPICKFNHCKSAKTILNDFRCELRFPVTEI